jgi:Flp pilus assembly protein CpaB
VIVARERIEARQVILPDQLETKSLLLSEVPSGAVFRLEDAAGKFTLQPFEAGQPLLAQSLASISPSAGGSITTTSKLAALLPPTRSAWCRRRDC